MEVLTNKKISNESSLLTFFYENLSKVNRNNLCPLPEEFIFYSSQVLEKYAFSTKYYQIVSGHTENKVFGKMYLEANLSQDVNQFKDIGDTLLVKLGFFPDSIKKVGIQEDYYYEIGKSAYSSLEVHNCSFYEIPNFYKLFATSFENIVNVVRLMSGTFEHGGLSRYLLETLEEGEASLVKPASLEKSS